MTNQPIDARPACFVAAMDTLRAAQKCKLEVAAGVRQTIMAGGTIEGQPLEQYWALIAEAAIYAELAKAPTDVGIAAGTHMTARDERQVDARNRTRAAARAARQAYAAERDAAEQHRAEQFGDPRKTRPIPYEVHDRIRVAQPPSNMWLDRTGTVAGVRRAQTVHRADALLVTLDPIDDDPEPMRQVWISARDVVRYDGVVDEEVEGDEPAPRKCCPSYDNQPHHDKCEPLGGCPACTAGSCTLHGVQGVPRTAEEARAMGIHVCEYADPNMCGWPGHRA